MPLAPVSRGALSSRSERPAPRPILPQSSSKAAISLVPGACSRRVRLIPRTLARPRPVAPATRSSHRSCTMKFELPCPLCVAAASRRCRSGASAALHRCRVLPRRAVEERDLSFELLQSNCQSASATSDPSSPAFWPTFLGSTRGRAAFARGLRAQNIRGRPSLALCPADSPSRSLARRRRQLPITPTPSLANTPCRRAHRPMRC